MSRYSALVFLVMIVVLGTFLRFYRIKNLGTFRGDQAIELSSAAQILRGKFTLIGIKTSISEVHNGAVMYYIIAPFLYLFAFDPVAGGIVQSLLSLATIPVIYYLGRQLKNGNAALLASLFIAASPLLVRFSRQTMLALYPLFFCSLALLLAGKIVIHCKNISCFLFGILLGFMLQIHYSTICVLWFALVMPLFFVKRNYLLRYYLLLFLGFVVGFAPMLIFELRHQFFNTKMLLNFFLQPKNFIVPVKFNLYFYWENVVAKLLLGDNIIITGWFVIVFIIIFFIFQRKLQLLEKLCILQLILTVIFTAFFVHEIVPHYAIVSFVPLALLCSSFLGKIIKIFWQKWQKQILAITILSFFLINYPGYGLKDNHGWTMAEGWSLPGVEKSARIIYSDVSSSNYNVIMLVDAENQGLPLRYFLGVWGKPPLPVDKYDKADVLYIVVEPKVDLVDINMWEINSFGAYSIENNWQIQNGFILYRLGKKKV